ncbi:helix-turn-helix transcriptional regulator [Methylobacterium indicum]|uniref:helix-turn-helix transcriptional regulator n=1 Tax=Methylobacterium indicum TaxID=1775910 RepID=UPI000B223D90|nr:DNA-binding protein [Methylobacterium indicum]
MSTDESDLLYGVPAIARHLKMTDRQVYHLDAKGQIPTFRVGGKVCWSRSGVARWLAEQEAAARQPRPAPKPAAPQAPAAVRPEVRRRGR